MWLGFALVPGTQSGNGDTGMDRGSRSSTGPVEKVEAVDTTISDLGRILRVPVCRRGDDLPVRHRAGNVTRVTDRER